MPVRRMNTRTFVGLAVLVIAVAGQVVRAGDIRSKLPDKSVLYIEFAGDEKVADARGTTPFGKILNDEQVKKMISVLWNKGGDLLVAEAEKNGEGTEVAAVKQMAGVLFKKGLSIDLIGMEMTEFGPDIGLVVVSDMGGEAESFVKSLEAVLAKAELPPAVTEDVGGKQFKTLRFPIPFLTVIRYGVVDGLFVAGIGANSVNKVLACVDGQAPNLAGNKSIAAAMEKIGTKGRTTAMFGHLDVAELMAQGKTFYKAMTAQEEIPPMASTLLEELGVNAIKSLTFTCQIADGGFRKSVYMATEGERKGLLKLAEQKALTDDDLLWIPQDTPFALAANVDIGAAYDETMRVLGMLPLAFKDDIDEVLAELKEEVELDIRQDLLSKLDDTFVLYDSPSAGGFLVTGFTLVAEVKDSEGIEKLIARGVEALIVAINKEGDDFTGTLLTRDFGKYKITYLQLVGLPLPLAPAYCIHKGHIVLGLTPQVVRVTMDRMVSADPRGSSILAKADFVRGRGLLPESLSSVAYTDTKHGMEQLYPLLGMGGIMGLNMARSVDLDLDAAMIPDMVTMTSGLYGDVWGASVTDSGVLKVACGPLPVPVPVMAGGTPAVPALAMTTSILLPSLSRARHLSKRLVSASNLKGIGTACLIYAYENQGNFPPDFDTLIHEDVMTAKQLVAPSDPTGGPSYIYIAGHTKNSAPHWVVAYESWFGQTEGANVLFVDGHVEFVMPLDRVLELVDQTKQEMAEKKGTQAPQ